jgi:hypothetical protein
MFRAAFGATRLFQLFNPNLILQAAVILFSLIELDEQTVRHSHPLFPMAGGNYAVQLGGNFVCLSACRP